MSIGLQVTLFFNLKFRISSCVENRKFYDICFNYFEYDYIGNLFNLACR